MRIRALRDAIKAYAEDLASRDPGAGAGAERDAAVAALEAIALPGGLFRGMLDWPFEQFRALVGSLAPDTLAQTPSAPPTIGDALKPLKRLLRLMDALATANRRKDLAALIGLLANYESANIHAFNKAVAQLRRHGTRRRPPMTPDALDQMKAALEAALGDDDAFEKVLADIEELPEEQFADVAGTVLHAAFKGKKQGLSRLRNLHAATRTRRRRRAAEAGRSAA